jgi:hypothetical protein
MTDNAGNPIEQEGTTEAPPAEEGTTIEAPPVEEVELTSPTSNDVGEQTLTNADKAEAEDEPAATGYETTPG